MARIERPRRVGETLEVMGGTMPLVNNGEGWRLDLSQVPLGALATHKDVYRPVVTTYAPTVRGFPARELIEGKYSAHRWVERYLGTVKRAMRALFHRHEWEGQFVDLYNHPTKTRHLTIDTLAHPGEKRDRVIKHIATEESLITTVEGGRGKGKALALDTPIPTPLGWTTMGSLGQGDLVFGMDGAPAPVSWVTEVMEGRVCYEVKFDDESSIIADADHLWLARIGGVDPLDAIVIGTTEQLAVFASYGDAEIDVPKTRELKISPTRATKLDLDATSSPSRTIVSFKPVKSVPVKCIGVANHDHMYLAGQTMVPTHNSVTTADILHEAWEKHGRNICMLDTRPRHLLPKFVRRVVDLRAVDPEEIVWIDEGADMFSHRQSNKRGSIGLPAILARARHLGLTVVALTPTSGIMDKVFDVLSDAMLIKPGTMNQETYSRASGGRISGQFPELLPKQKEWSVFVSNLIAPTTFPLPYVCNNPKHDSPSVGHQWTCCIPRFWKPEFSRSQMSAAVQIHESVEHQELAYELLFWGNRLEQIAETLDKRNCHLELQEWADFLHDYCNGIHPSTGRALNNFPTSFGMLHPRALAYAPRDREGAERRQREQLSAIMRQQPPRARAGTS